MQLLEITDEIIILSNLTHRETTWQTRQLLRSAQINGFLDCCRRKGIQC
jgi:hypothetical protein